MNRHWIAIGVLVAGLLGIQGSARAGWVVGQVHRVDMARSEIVIDDVRYGVNRQTRDQAGRQVMLSRFQAGDGVLYRVGDRQMTLQGLEKPAGGIDMPPALRVR